MEESFKKEIKDLIQKLGLKCSVEEFIEEIDWSRISSYQQPSEDFLREFSDTVNWAKWLK